MHDNTDFWLRVTADYHADDTRDHIAFLCSASASFEEAFDGSSTKTYIFELAERFLRATNEIRWQTGIVFLFVPVYYNRYTIAVNDTDRRAIRTAFLAWALDNDPGTTTLTTL